MKKSQVTPKKKYFKNLSKCNMHWYFHNFGFIKGLIGDKITPQNLKDFEFVSLFS